MWILSVRGQSAEKYMWPKSKCVHPFFSRSPVFQQFVKVALTKNPKKRPSADKLLEVGTGKLMTRMWCVHLYSVLYRTTACSFAWLWAIWPAITRVVAAVLSVSLLCTRNAEAEQASSCSDILLNSASFASVKSCFRSCYCGVWRRELQGTPDHFMPLQACALSPCMQVAVMLQPHCMCVCVCVWHVSGCMCVCVSCVADVRVM